MVVDEFGAAAGGAAAVVELDKPRGGRGRWCGCGCGWWEGG